MVHFSDNTEQKLADVITQSLGASQALQINYCTGRLTDITCRLIVLVAFFSRAPAWT